MLQVLQKDSVNQTETAVVTRYPWLKMHAVTHTGGWSRSLKSLSEIMHSAWGRTGKDKMCD